MKSYKNYHREYIGVSDIAKVYVVGLDENGDVKSGWLQFNADGEYRAYIVDEEAEIGSHYTKVMELCKWIYIVDDTNKVVYQDIADRINIYRAGDFGCIIQLIKEDK